MFVTISSSGRIRRSISTHGPVITNDCRISVARAIVGNRAISGSDQRPMYDQLLRPTTDRTINRGDRSYEQSRRPVTNGTTNRCILGPIVQAFVASCMWPIVLPLLASYDRAYDQSWGATIDRTINRSIVRPIVATYHRPCDPSWQSWHQTTDRTINCSIMRAIVRSILRLLIRDHPQRVVPPCTIT